MAAGMNESQKVEWKSRWRDEYLRWICGFANAEGGVLVIGRDDDGVVGLSGIRKLLEDIPNKVRDVLGIVVDVNLKAEAGKEYLEIVVGPHAHPVRCKGEYHYRSGSTRQELKGATLSRFLLRKQGLHWDGVRYPTRAWRTCQRRRWTGFGRRPGGAGVSMPRCWPSRRRPSSTGCTCGRDRPARRGDQGRTLGGPEVSAIDGGGS